MTQTVQKSSNGPGAVASVPGVFQRLRREMDELFDNFAGGFDLRPEWSGEVMLKTDISENDDALSITAEMPGVDEKDVEFTFDGDLLTIRGEKKQERDEKKDRFHVKERSWGSFQRVIAVPFAADPDKVQASFSNGVLKLVVPKPPGAKKSVKKIAVKANA